MWQEAANNGYSLHDGRRRNRFATRFLGVNPKKRPRDDFRRFGADAFSVEVLDLLDIKPEMTETEIRDDLAALEQLWRERLDPALLY